MSKSKIYMVSFLAFEYLVFRCNKFREPRIDLHALHDPEGSTPLRLKEVSTKQVGGTKIID